MCTNTEKIMPIIPATRFAPQNQIFVLPPSITFALTNQRFQVHQAYSKSHNLFTTMSGNVRRSARLLASTGAQISSHAAPESEVTENTSTAGLTTPAADHTTEIETGDHNDANGEPPEFTFLCKQGIHPATT
jgi:hypothetical protein